MKKRLLLVRGVHTTLDLMSREMEKYFRAMEYDIFVLDASNLMDSLSKLYPYLSSNVDALITFNNVAMNMELTPGRKLWEELGIRCINILVDHPYHYMQELQNAPSHTTIVCVDENHVEFVGRFFPNIERCVFLPHGGTCWRNCGEDLPENSGQGEVGKEKSGKKDSWQEDAWKRRPIQVLYVGSLSRDAAKKYVPNQNLFAGIDGAELERTVYARMLEEPCSTYEWQLERYIRELGIRLSDPELLIVIRAYRFLDPYVVSHFRELAIQNLVEAGIPVTLYGERWENSSCIHNPNLDYRGFVSPEKVLELMGQAKIVLNSQPGFKKGAHERIFNGMLSGAAVVSDTSEYLQEQVHHILTYDLRNPMDVVERVRELLAHSDETEELTRQAYREARAAHTWTERARLLDELIL